MTVEEGQPAPDFSLPTADGDDVQLSALRGNPVIVYFYPKADTPGCTKEACGFTEALAALGTTGVRVIGISKDAVPRLAKFRDKHGLTVTLASDEEGKTVEAYGAWVEKNMYGRTYMGIDRSTFLIDENGIVRHAWRKVKVPGHVDEVVTALKQL
ncbi:thioredoxin-dependent thiol peroxidase [Fodinicurvata sp. EGI_FJ10296]|uniref:thioredoxin-dependent thiol peroxidase n=1 Tax=Fodinicurvata sp. EGI_FJ10296 TaxID=3231908 RepID=UPI003455154B